jgi:hypothetical protein
MEENIVISENSTAEEIAPIVKAVNDLLVIPVTMRGKTKKGVSVEKGEVVDFEYTGLILEQVLKENRVIRTIYLLLVNMHDYRLLLLLFGTVKEKLSLL